MGPSPIILRLNLFFKVWMISSGHSCIKIQNQFDFEEFISYNQLMDFLEQSSEPEELADGYFKFRGIKAHQGPLNPDHPDYKESTYNLLAVWETEEVTYETLTQLSMDDPVSRAD